MTSEVEDRQVAVSPTAAASPPKVEHLTVDERVARGSAARAAVPRASQATLDVSGDRDPVGILDADTPNRTPELVPIRYGRMLASPFAFYRGSATLMAHDLAATPTSGLRVQLCGDAHLANFGGFASPERAMVFDLNDFDETHPGPFEWDVKRLAASFEIAARYRGFDEKQREAAVLTVLEAYRESMRNFAAMRDLDVWYSRLDSESLEARLRSERDKRGAKVVKRGTTKAQTKNSLRAFAKLTHDVDGEPRIKSDPPLVVPIEELLPDEEARDVTSEIRELIRGYRRTLQRDRRRLLEGFRFVHMARKVVGVGSVGTQCWIVLMLGRDNDDPLFLQCKEAGPSVLEPSLGRSSFTNHGQRIVEGQRLMQAASDIFLGWIHVKEGLDGRSRDFYIRQLWDWKTSADLDSLVPAGLVTYAQMCGWTLARAHSRSGDRVAIATYLGKSRKFDSAVAEFAAAYADVNERDFHALQEAVRTGRITAREGV